MLHSGPPRRLPEEIDKRPIRTGGTAMVLHAKEARRLDDHPGGWNRSHQSSTPRLFAWVLAIAVVGVLAVGLHALYY